eukprot:TRINITY_DN4510_c0_g1_i7.p1 TRINITY_DN4510_c0_g1~~TRINITY_DN4510_c0_g1_i7.p1  ORF type:complete len:451 (-),score=43.09 TRINITY_DN4510_c0_g1_i7:61-1413(-)
MKAIVLPEFSNELEIENNRIPRPGPGQVLVKIHNAVLHESDLHYLSGEHPNFAKPPLIPGVEATGIVIESGGGFTGWSLIGKKVICLSDENQNGTWAEYLITSVENCVELDDDIDLNKDSCSFLEILTGFGLIETIQKEKVRTVIIRIKRMSLAVTVYKLLEKLDLEVLFFVNSEIKAGILRKLGALEVLDINSPTFTNHFGEKMKEQLDVSSLYIDDVWDERSSQIMGMLPARSICYVFGFSPGNRIKSVNPQDLITRGIRLKGFWPWSWYKKLSYLARTKLIFKVRKQIKDIGLYQVTHIYGLDEVDEAVQTFYQGDMEGHINLKICLMKDENLQHTQPIKISVQSFHDLTGKSQLETHSLSSSENSRYLSTPSLISSYDSCTTGVKGKPCFSEKTRYDAMIKSPKTKFLFNPARILRSEYLEGRTKSYQKLTKLHCSLCKILSLIHI